MTVEQTQTGNTQVTDQNTPPANKTADGTTTSNTEGPSVKKVDLWGTEVELPADKAEALIQLRDSRVNEYNELKTKLDSLVSEKAQAEARAEAEEKSKRELELAKKGELDALRESVTKEYKDKIEQLTSTLVKQKIRDSILSIENVNKKAIDTIARLVEAERPILEGDSVKVGEKPLSEYVSSLISDNDYFQVVTSPVGTGGSKPTNPGTVAGVVNVHDAIHQGMQERMKKA